MNGLSEINTTLLFAFVPAGRARPPGLYDPLALLTAGHQGPKSLMNIHIF